MKTTVYYATFMNKLNCKKYLLKRVYLSMPLNGRLKLFALYDVFIA